RVVRDGIASAYVHDFIDPQRIDEVIRGITGLGYRYISIRDFPCRTANGGRLVLTHGAHGTVALDDDFLHEFVLTARGRVSRERYSPGRLSGNVAPTLEPGEGETLVASASLDSPAPEAVGFAARVGSAAQWVWRLVGGLGPTVPPPPKPLSVALV